jgi:hypothetical protein
VAVCRDVNKAKIGVMMKIFMGKQEVTPNLVVISKYDRVLYEAVC